MPNTAPTADPATHGAATPQAPEHDDPVAAGVRQLPAFAAIMSSLRAAQPLAGARIACTLPFTPEATVLVEALESLGADLRWTQTRPGAASARGGARRLFDWPGESGPNLLLERGAAASRLIHAGTRREGRADFSPHFLPYSAVATTIRGTTEVSVHGAHWLARQSAQHELLYPAMDCSSIGAFAALKSEDRTLRTSSAMSLIVLSQIELFHGDDRAASLFEPPSALRRVVANAHDDLLRSRIDKLRDKPSGALGDVSVSPAL